MDEHYLLGSSARRTSYLFSFLFLLLYTSLFAGAWALMLTTDGFYTFTNVQCSWLAFVRRFYWAYLIRDIHTHRLYRKAMNYVLGIGLVVKDQRRFPRDPYTFVYVWLCGQEMETAFYFIVIPSAALFASP
jgi:hypothetical protein